MKKILLINIFLLVTIAAQAQVKTLRDTIQVLRHPFGWHYKQYGETLKPRTLLRALESNPEAHKVMRRSVHTNDVATTATFLGAGLILGGTAAYALAGKDINLPLMGAGIGLAIVSIPIAKSSARHTEEAVEIYNSDLRALHQSGSRRAKLYYSGLGFQLRF